MVINVLIIVKANSNIIFLSIKVSIDKSQYFIHILSVIINKPQLTLNIYKKLSKTLYNDYTKLVNIAIRFSSKKSFSNLPIYIDEKELIIE